ncbi:glutaredoxin family protein [Vreelandella rituensis]|uniref:Glutaredoxin family protein n=1 Tax=Vreelandella rituensis TaxID=2282306 RepID=A0A368U1A9_9GAMM|nr:glutaredoxin family protein [Halomonas rituensis]RCV90366.1 glutaredoxin family protein [Halomonas rituensis]
MIQLRLYTTLGCHLCEQLEALIHTLANDEVVLSHIEISDDAALMERYGVRIPVVIDEAGKELDRGFELERLSEWLKVRGWLDEVALATLTGPVPAPSPKAAYQRNGRRFLG